MKRILSLVLAALMLCSICGLFASCGDNADTTKASTETLELSGKELKVGAIMVGDNTEGYTQAHIDGINAAKAAIEAKGGTVKLTWKLKVTDTSNTACAAALNELAQTNDVVLTNSYGHQFAYGKDNDNGAIPKQYPNVTFVSMTGDLAAGTGLNNYKNAFTQVYQSRYVSGVIAGLKLKELIADGLVADSNKDADGNIKIGYVGAFAYAEVVSGYTAFFLGLKSVVSNVAMSVKYTNSWYDYDAEYTTAKDLIASGCIIIGQHADSEGAPTACQEAYETGKQVYSVGYNVDMLKAAPDAAITSATNNWAVYYTYLFYTAMTKTSADIATNWSEGYDTDAVAVTKINKKLFKADPTATVDGIIAKIKDGSLKVFDTSKFTVKGATLTTYKTTAADFTLAEGTECIKKDGDTYYFDESTLRSAPYFTLRIDGITEITTENK